MLVAAVGFRDTFPMITAREVRAARVFLGWTRQRLADRAVVSLNSVIRLEQGIVSPRQNTISAVARVLQQAGIEFLSMAGAGEGIQFKKPLRKAAKSSKGGRLRADADRPARARIRAR